MNKSKVVKSKDAQLARMANSKQSAIKRFVKIIRESSGVSVTEVTAEELINQAIIDNPDMKASTFYNTLKSMGIQFVKSSQQVKQADSTSVAPQNLRQESKRINHKLAIKTNHFTESISAEKPKDGMVGFVKFGTILLQEGMGNFGTSFFYTKEALKSAIPVFEGKKCFADHPKESEEIDRPERSVRDVLGYFKNVRYEESASGRGQLCGDLAISPEKPFDWARSLMTIAVEYSKEFPDKDFVGLSINASGDASRTPIESMMESGVCDEVKQKMVKARDEFGITELEVVYKFDEAVSCDLVTEAGAAGKIKLLMEGNHMKDKNKKKKESEVPEKEVGAEGQESSQAAGHDDAEQDAVLIQKMISKYMGDDAVASDEECGIVKEAYQACTEMGMSPEDSEKHAVNTMKMSKHMASKQAEADKKEADEKAVKEADESAKKESDDKDADDAKEKKESAAPVESDEVKKLKEANAKLQGENTALVAKLGNYDIQNHIEKICKESGLKTEVTKKFREAVKELKSVSDIDKTWKTWKSAFDSINESVVVHNFAESIALNPEKQSASSGSGDFADSISKN